MTTHTLPPEVKVRPLEWSEAFTDASGYTSYDTKPATAVGGGYAVYRVRPEKKWCAESSSGRPLAGMFDTADEAKAAAQADYTARIVSALEPSGESVGAEPVAWLALAGENKSRCLCWTEGVALSEADGDRSRIQPLYAQPLTGMEGALDDLIAELGRWDTFQFGSNAAQQGGVGTISHLTPHNSEAPMTDPQELSRRLRQRGKEIRTLNIGVGSALAEANVTLLNEAASLIDAQAAEIARCHARLEIDHFFVMGENDDLERVDVPMNERAGVPDAVSARDATIALLETDARAQAARIAELEKALTEIRDGLRSDGRVWLSMPPEPCGEGDWRHAGPPLRTFIDEALSNG